MGLPDPNRRLRDHPIRAFFQEKHVDLCCPSCGKDEWVVSEPGEGSVPAVTYIAHGAPAVALGTLRYTPVYLLYCENCGYLRMYDREHVDRSQQRAAP